MSTKVLQVLRQVAQAGVEDKGIQRSVKLSALRSLIDTSLEQLSCSEVRQSQESEQGARGEGAVVFPDSGSDLRCGTCGCAFSKLEEQREHFRTDWHRLNQRLKLKNKPALSLLEAESVLNRSDAESLSGSASEASLSEDEDDANATAKQRSFADQIDLRIQGFPEVCAQMYGAVVLNSGRSGLDYTVLGKDKYWVVLMYSAGHFAGVIYQEDAIVATKTFHRYVVRKGQGGSQSAKDNTGKRAKSAGATLRRYNEQLLSHEISDLLKKWKSPYLEEAVRVFVAVSKSHRHVLFKDQEVLSAADPRVRRIPFITKRPTVKEAKCAMDRLRSVRLYHRTEIKVSSKDKSVAISGVEKKGRREPKAHVEAVTKQEPTEAAGIVDPRLQKLFETIKDGSLQDLSDALEALDREDPETLVQTLVQTNENGETVLHLAASIDNSEMIALLLEWGVTPEFRDSHGRTCYQKCKKKSSRDAFRQFMGKYPSRWDYKKAQIPSPLTDEMADARKEKNKLKKKRQAERRRQKKLEQKKEEEEKAALDAAPSPGAPLCSFCSKALGDPDEVFYRLDFKYCSNKCAQDHRRQLAAEAALKRVNG